MKTSPAPAPRWKQRSAPVIKRLATKRGAIAGWPWPAGFQNPLRTDTMTAYHVGASAERIISVRITRDGAISSVVHQAAAEGMLRPGATADQVSVGAAAKVEFVARVSLGHSGTVEILPGKPRLASAYTIIPLGVDHPCLNSELAPSPGAPGSTSQSTCVHFLFADGRLRWKTENVTGQVEMNATTPGVTVNLRLPRENEGGIFFPAACARQSYDATVAPSDV